MDDLGRIASIAPDGEGTTRVSYAPRRAGGGAIVGVRSHVVDDTGAESTADYDELGRAIQRGHRGFDGAWIEQAHEVRRPWARRRGEPPGDRRAVQRRYPL